jgi:hypothetical protein
VAWINIQSMVLPSREFLISEVDREFLLQHPEAPRQLDPNDPSQAHLRQQWNEMFTEFLNRMVDSHFFRFFPNAPEHLDPHDPEQSVLIEYWNDIHDSIRDGTPSRWNWDNPPHAGDDASAASSTGSSTGPSTDAGAHPDLAVHLDESQFKELVHTALEGTHVIGDSAEVLG